MVNQIKKAAKWLLPAIMLLPLRPGHRDGLDEPSAWRLLAVALEAALVLACRIVYRFAAQSGVLIVVDEQVAHHRGMLQRESA